MFLVFQFLMKIGISPWKPSTN